MAIYIKLDDAVEAFKKAEADDKSDFVKYGIFDENFANFFPAERAIEIIIKCRKYLMKNEVDKYGKWEWFDEETGTPIDGYEREWGWRCSCCKIELSDDYDNPDIYPKMKYCFNCGARMDEGNEPEN